MGDEEARRTSPQACRNLEECRLGTEEVFLCGKEVTYPTKYKRLRAAFPRSALGGMHVTIRSNEGRMKRRWMLELLSLGYSD
jgi:hypothetical protein